MDAREIEALEMISRGFEDLSNVNPKLAYTTIVELLLTINEYVLAPGIGAFVLVADPDEASAVLLTQQKRKCSREPDGDLSSKVGTVKAGQCRG